jgi:hypothetical protein
LEEKWEIGGIRGSCAACGSPLPCGTEVVSALSFAGESFARKDFCAACWETADRAPFFSFWRTKVPAREEKAKTRTVDVKVLEDLFLRLVQEKDPAKEEILFLLSMLLVQKRVLKYREMKAVGNRRFVLVGKPRSPKTWEIVDPGMEPEKMAALRDELKRILELEEGGETA